MRQRSYLLNVIPAGVKVVNFENDSIFTHKSSEIKIKNALHGGKLDQNTAHKAPCSPWPTGHGLHGALWALFPV